MKRNFEEWFARFKISIYDYVYYVGFDKVFENVENMKMELGILNSLIGSQNIESDFKAMLEKYPETLKCIPILLAVREHEIFVQDLDENKEYLYNFEEMNYSVEQYMIFMHRTGLFDLLANKIICNLTDYVLGVETGLDSNARKNRSGKLMENLVEKYIRKAGFQKDISYFKEMKSSEIKRKWNVDLSTITHAGVNVKKFDFVVKGASVIYGIETNFYGSSGSKPTETARSYKMLATQSENISNFRFVWITDGAGWNGAKGNLQETFDALDMLYNIDELENGILPEVLI